ncbi:MAG: helix-hairpin-helix domain-containing protein [Bacteroidota bacterium]
MINQFLNQIKRYFGFSNSETGGFLILILLLIAFISLPLIYRLFPVDSEPLSYSDQIKLDSLQKELLSKIEQKSEPNQYEKDTYSGNYNQFSNEKAEFASKKLFKFDPNRLDMEGFKTLGLPDFLAQRIIKYRNAGGKFKTKEDLQKIYGLLPATYSKLEPFIIIENNSDHKFNENFSENKNNPDPNLAIKQTYTKENSFKKPISFDLNTADTTIFMTIKGIGSKLSQRIIKFRDNLGGFHSENQVREVFGLDSTVVIEILKYGSIKSGIYHRIEINQTNELRHPYLKPYIAKAILAYRNQHGTYNGIDDLRKIKLLNEATLSKINPYLKY